MFQYVHAQVVSDNKSERMTKIAIIFNIAIAIAKKSSAEMLLSVLGTIKLKLIYKQYLTAK